MASEAERAGSGALRAAATVLVRPTGVALVRLLPGPFWEAAAAVSDPLDAADLGFLIALRATGDPVRAAADVALPADRRDRLVALLDELGLVTDVPPASPPTVSAPLAPSTGVPPDPTLLTPLCLRIVPDGLEALDHDGRLLVRLSPDQVVAAALLASHRAAGTEPPPEALDPSLLATLAAAGLLRSFAPEVDVNAEEAGLRKAFLATAALRGTMRAANERYAAEDATRDAAGGGRVPVVGVQVSGNVPPLSTGMVLANLGLDPTGSLREVYDLRPRWVIDASDAPELPGQPAIYLFTNYLWSHQRNLDVAAQLKARNPAAIMVHGGPDCPSYPGDSERYVAGHPQVDVAVRGEGEVTATELLLALAPSLAAGAPDLSALVGVPGLTVSVGAAAVRTDARPRIDDVDVIPSPYLTGVFDAFGTTRQMSMAIIETNRGCPYGCTFCDWGSATNSRIRKFDLQRVLDELEWCARHEVPRVFFADANFGIFARDVEIAQHFVSLKERYGFPQRFITNYAKNTVKHLREIVGTLADGGILSEGLMSLQSMDDDTLTAIRRSNIKLEKYEALAKEFRQAGLPLFVDLMMGLPGQTVGSLHADLQQCVDREVSAKVHTTELLVNSPMNDPEYRQEHQVESIRPPGVGSGSERPRGPAFVVSTSTFSRDDFRRMHEMRSTYLLVENLGVLRQVSRFVRREVGMREVELYERLRDVAAGDPDRWPHLALGLVAGPDVLVPPQSWAPFVDEVRELLVTDVGLGEGSALDTVLTVQHLLLPAPGRTFPTTVELAHDHAKWSAAIVAAKDDGHLHDWELHVPRLEELPPASFTVDDPQRLCLRNLGQGSAIDPYQDWELESPVSRAMPAHYQVT